MDFTEPLSFNEFKKATFEAWKEKALKELKKDSLEILQWKNKDNLVLQPYYNKKTRVANPSFHHQVNSPNDFAVDARWWENRQEIETEDPVKSNQLILEALEGGADGVVLNPVGAINLEKVLNGVKADYCSVSLLNSNQDFFHHYKNFIQSKKNSSGEIYWEKVASIVKMVDDPSWKELPTGIRCFGITPDKDTDEIVSLLLKTKTFLDSINAQYHNNIISRFAWQISVSEDYFQGIARIKALRMLLFQVISAYNISVRLDEIFIYAVSPVFSNEEFGPHENMLKSTTAAMAAIIGGCNAIYVEPSDKNSTMQRRIARNVSLVLKEEAHLSKNLDPSAGSYFIESLIDQTAKHQWQKFQDLV